MKEVFLFVVIAAWIAVCGWAVERVGNFVPDRSMRLLTKFLLFVLFVTMPLLHMAAKAAELCDPVKWGEQTAQWSTLSMGEQDTNKKGLL